MVLRKEESVTGGTPPRRRPEVVPGSLALRDCVSLSHFNLISSFWSCSSCLITSAYHRAGSWWALKGHY